MAQKRVDSDAEGYATSDERVVRLLQILKNFEDFQKITKIDDNSHFPQFFSKKRVFGL
eukprot:COSAG01_NODE_71547_length_255_cov_1.314103_1_plen_57_part_10